MKGFRNETVFTTNLEKQIGSNLVDAMCACSDLVRPRWHVTRIHPPNHGISVLCKRELHQVGGAI